MFIQNDDFSKCKVNAKSECKTVVTNSALRFANVCGSFQLESTRDWLDQESNDNSLEVHVGFVVYNFLEKPRTKSRNKRQFISYRTLQLCGLVSQYSFVERTGTRAVVT